MLNVYQAHQTVDEWWWCQEIDGTEMEKVEAGKLFDKNRFSAIFQSKMNEEKKNIML